MPDSTLQTVANEVGALLKRHDVAAFAMFASRTHTHYLHQLETSWTCTWFEGEVLRIRSKLADYPNIEAQKQVLEDTLGMLAGFVAAARQEADSLERVLLAVGREGVEIQHVSRSEKPSLLTSLAAGMTEAHKARSFDILVKHIATIMPPEAAIKHLTGTPLIEALTDFVFVPKTEWERLNRERPS